MKRFSEQFKKQSESITMRASERKALRERLVSYMEYHPLPKQVHDAPVVRAKGVEGIVSEPFRVIKFNMLYVRSFAGLFAILLVVGIPFVAEHSLPGDVLYPVKIQFNEQLRSTLAISPYAKVQWETETLERRISEARLLASEGKLTSETETQVAQAVKSHADAAQQEIAQLRQSDSDGAAIAEIALSSALDVQSEVLSGNASKDAQNQNGHSVAALAQVVAQARDSVQAAQSQSGQPSYEKLLARIEQESTHVSELFESVKTEASPEEVSAVERSLADIGRKVAQAKAIKNGDTVSDADASIMNVVLPIDTVASSTEATTTGSATTSTSSITTIATDTSDSVTSSTSSSLSASSSVTSGTTTVVSDDATSSVSTTTPQAAINLLRSALGDIQKVISYLTHIDVRQNVSLQDLVPVTQTSEERMSEISNLYDDTRDMQSKILDTTYTSDVRSKVALGENKIETDLTNVIAAVKKGNLDSALSSVTEAHTVASELLTFPSTLKHATTTSASTSTSTTTNQLQKTTQSDSAE